MKELDKAMKVMGLAMSLTTEEHDIYNKWNDRCAVDSDIRRWGLNKRYDLRLAKLEEILCNRLDKEIWDE